MVERNGNVKFDEQGRPYFQRYGTTERDYEGTPSWNKPKGVQFPEQFVSIFKSAFSKIKLMGLTGREYDVLMGCFEYLQFKNWLNLNQTKLAVELGMKPGDVSKAMKTLMEKGIIEKHDEQGSPARYRISYRLSWKGPADTWHAEDRKMKIAQLHANDNLVDFSLQSDASEPE